MSDSQGERAGGLLISLARRTRTPDKGGRRRMVVPAQRGVNRRLVSLLGSANLVRPRLCLNGPSNIASRHRRLGKGARLGAPRVGRLRMAPAVTRACTPRRSQVTTIRLQGSKASDWAGPYISGCSSRAERKSWRALGWEDEKRRSGRSISPPPWEGTSEFEGPRAYEPAHGVPRDEVGKIVRRT
jgi:hypothetical protein